MTKLISIQPEWRKRAFDVTAASAGLIIGAPLILAAAFAMAAVNRSSPLFVQQRVGRGGLPFDLYKIKTMKDAVAPDGARRDDDARHTRLGQYLRRTRIDELPQLVNVLKGEMSIVGPRPLLAAQTIAFHPRRLEMRPGLTGYAQLDVLQRPYSKSGQNDRRRLAFDMLTGFNKTVRDDLRIVRDTLAEIGKRTLGRTSGASRSYPRLRARRPRDYPTIKINQHPD